MFIRFGNHAVDTCRVNVSMVHNGEIVQALLCGGKERWKDGILILLVKIV